MSDSKSLLGKYVETEEGDILFIVAVFSLFIYNNKQNYFIVLRQVMDTIISQFVKFDDYKGEFYLNYGRKVILCKVEKLKLVDKKLSNVLSEDIKNLSEDRKRELIERHRKSLIDLVKYNRVLEMRRFYYKKTLGKISKIPYYKKTMRTFLRDYFNPEGAITVFSGIKKNKRIDY